MLESHLNKGSKTLAFTVLAISLIAVVAGGLLLSQAEDIDGYTTTTETIKDVKVTYITFADGETINNTMIAAGWPYPTTEYTPESYESQIAVLNEHLENAEVSGVKFVVDNPSGTLPRIFLTAGTIKMGVYNEARFGIDMGGSTHTYSVTLIFQRFVESIEIDGDSTVTQNSTTTWTRSLTPTDAAYKDVEWSVVSGSSYVSISTSGTYSENCTITGKSAGTATIRCSATDGSGEYVDKTITVKKQCKVSIVVQGNGYVTQDEVTITEGGRYSGSSSGTMTFTAPSGGTTSYKSVTATANSGYTFTGWSPSSGTITSDMTIYANFEISKRILSIEYKYANGGSAAGTVTYNLNAGQYYNYTVPSITGYTPNMSTVSGTMPDSNTTVTVVYTPISYQITVSAGTGGTVSGGGTYVYNSTATITASPSLGYKFVKWADGSTDQSRQITVTGSASYTAEFAVQSYTVTVHYVYENGGTVRESVTKEYSYNQNYTIASPSIEGYTPDYGTITGTMAASNITETVTYRANSYTLNVYYQKTDGTTIAPTDSRTLKYGEEYDIQSPARTGYLPDKPTVSGTMGARNVSVTVLYTIQSYPLVIHYVYTDGSEAFDDYTLDVKYGDAYAQSSPVKTGYTADKRVVQGTMDENGYETKVTYTVNAYKVTVNYIYKASGQSATSSDSRVVNYGDTYKIDSPSILGYSPDKASVQGTMGAANIEESVYYTANSYKLTVHYQYASGKEASGDHTEMVEYGKTYSVSSPSIPGYLPDTAVLTGTMDTENGIEIYVKYNPVKYSLVIKYLDDTGRSVHTEYSGECFYDAEYSVDSPAVEGYTPDVATVKGKMDSVTGKTLTVTYTSTAPKYHTLTIESWCNSTKIGTETRQVAEGAAYSYSAPEIDGYKVQSSYATVSSTMGTSDETAKVYYDAITYTLKISYVYADGTKVANGSHDISTTVGYKALYSYKSPEIAGYAPDQSLISGVASSDMAFKVTYTSTDIPTYEVTINTVTEADPTKIVGTSTSKHAEGATVTIEPPKMEGHAVKSIMSSEVTVSNGSFTMPAKAVTVTITYSADIHKVTVTYVYDDRSEAWEPDVINVAFGQDYRIEAPYIESYTPNMSVIEGTMGNSDVNVTVTYTLNIIPTHTVTVNHVREKDPSTPMDTDREIRNVNGNYEVSVRDYKGLSVLSISSDDVAISEGRYVMPDKDITITVTYEDVVYGVTVRYQFEDGSTASPTVNQKVAYGNSYSFASPYIPGYTASKASVSGVMSDETVDETVVYKPNSYGLEVVYRLSDGTVVKKDFYKFAYGTEYSFDTVDPTGYTASRKTIEGTMDSEGKVEYVECTAISYEIRFMVDGELYARYTANYNQVLYAPDDDPVKSGYTFTGWNGFVPGAKASEDRTYDATFKLGEAFRFSIEHMLEDSGTLLGTDTVYLAAGEEYSMYASQLAEEGCTLLYYVMDGQKTAISEGDDLLVKGEMPLHSVTITVYYEPKTYTLTILHLSDSGKSVADTEIRSVRFMDAYSVAGLDLDNMAPNVEKIEGTMPAYDLTVTFTYSARQGVAFIDELYTWSVTVAEEPESLTLDPGVLTFLSVTSSKREDGTGYDIIVSGTPTNTGLVSDTAYQVTLDADGKSYAWTVYVVEKSTFTSDFEWSVNGLKVICKIKENPTRVSEVAWDAPNAKTNTSVLRQTEVTITFTQFGTYTITCQVNYYNRYVADAVTHEITIEAKLGTIPDITVQSGKEFSMELDVPDGTKLSCDNGNVTFDGKKMTIRFDQSGAHKIVVTAEFPMGTKDSTTVNVYVTGASGDDGSDGKSGIGMLACAVLILAGVAVVYAGFALFPHPLIMVAGGIMTLLGILAAAGIIP